MQGHQGDVAIKQIQKLPQGLKKLQGTTLAYGEKTGHSHTLVADRPQVIIDLLEDAEGRKYFEIKNGTATLTHQEHGAVVFRPGVFVVGDEREYDVIEGVRRVQD